MNVVDTASLQKIVGFENTSYAYLAGEIVWHGDQALTSHPRNAFAPWRAQQVIFDANLLCQGANICFDFIKSNSTIANKNTGSAKDLLRWLIKEEMCFPLSLSTKRFDEIKAALVVNDLEAFKTAAERVLGLGNGLTPSGDDFIGGIFFALAHAPRSAWIRELPAVKIHIHNAAKVSTNVISAALLDDMMDGCSYSVLHDILVALHSLDHEKITASSEKLLTLGASSGADMLAGLLLALTTQPENHKH